MRTLNSDINIEAPRVSSDGGIRASGTSTVVVHLPGTASGGKMVDWDGGSPLDFAAPYAITGKCDIVGSLRFSAGFPRPLLKADLSSCKRIQYRDVRKQSHVRLFLFLRQFIFRIQHQDFILKDRTFVRIMVLSKVSARSRLYIFFDKLQESDKISVVSTHL